MVPEDLLLERGELVVDGDEGECAATEERDFCDADVLREVARTVRSTVSMDASPVDVLCRD
jgi:hypothetical protein